MNELIRLMALASPFCVAACTFQDTEPAAEPTGTSKASLTQSTETSDFAPECAGIIQYVNQAPASALAAATSPELAQALDLRRTQRSFADISDISSVSGVAQGRLEQLYAGALAASYVDASCAGIFDELAASQSDATAILGFVNAASEETLRDNLYANVNVVPRLLAGRPYATLAGVAATADVGPVTVRALRDATITTPLEGLINEVNGLHRDGWLDLTFNWFGALHEQPGRPRSLTCFGIDETLVTRAGGTLRPNLADSAEVVNEARSTVAYVARSGGLTQDPEIGLAELAARTAGHSFFGCYSSYEPDPWSGINRAFFVDTVTGYRLQTETRWSE